MSQDFLKATLDARHEPLVHIGYPKALSGWLQWFFFQPAHGFVPIAQPLDAMLGIIGQPAFEFDCSVLEEHSRAFRRNYGPLPADKVPVITGENLVGAAFSGGTGATLIAKRLRTCLPHARILVVVREQHDLVYSLYGESIRAGGMAHSLRRMLNPAAGKRIPQFHPSFLRYDGLVRYYQHLFGPSRVKVLPVEAFREDPSAFAEEIKRFASSEPPFKPLEREELNTLINTSSRPLTLSLMRLRNAYRVQNGTNPRGKYVDTFANMFRRDHASQRLDARLPRTPIDNWLERRHRRRIKASLQGEFAASNRRLAEMIDADLERYGYEMS